jgi:cytoskeletal protein RodZ
MKTVGQLLNSARLKKELSIEELSLATKIDSKYIEALEADRFDLLPSETFTKGFIRNISLRLESDPDELIAVFRRDYRQPDIKSSQIKTHKKTAVKLSFLSSKLFPITLGISVFVIYLVFQFRVILTPPPLEITRPSKDTVLVSPIDIAGTTSSDSLVTINDSNVVKPDQEGNFQIFLNLPVGETIITIKTTNRFSRSTTKTLPLTVISK